MGHRWDSNKPDFSTNFIYRKSSSLHSRKDAPWRKDPASEKQIAALLKFGVANPVGLTKGTASDLLQERFSQRRGGIATMAF